MSVDDYLADLATYAHAVDEVHSVGGLHPEWGVEHYETLFQRVAAEYPHISIKALTAVEIKHLGQRSSISTKEVLKRLKDAGLTSLPGGGAEILDDDVRAVICNGKESSEEYLESTVKPTRWGFHPTAPCCLVRLKPLNNASNT